MFSTDQPGKCGPCRSQRRRRWSLVNRKAPLRVPTMTSTRPLALRAGRCRLGLTTPRALSSALISPERAREAVGRGRAALLRVEAFFATIMIAFLRGQAGVYHRMGNVCTCGSVEVWKCGSVEVWKCGSVEVWKYATADKGDWQGGDGADMMGQMTSTAHIL